MIQNIAWASPRRRVIFVKGHGGYLDTASSGTLPQLTVTARVHHQRRKISIFLQQLPNWSVHYVEPSVEHCWLLLWSTWSSRGG